MPGVILVNDLTLENKGKKCRQDNFEGEVLSLEWSRPCCLGAV